MAQLFAQQHRQPDVWVMSGAPTATVVYLSLDTTINYSSGSPDTLPANTPAVIYGTSDTAFDRSLDVWVPLTVRGSHVLSIVKESQLATITADYVAMARVEMHGIRPYQPEPYLASGGLGSSVPTTSTVLLSSPGALSLQLWNGSSNDTPPAGWSDAGFADGSWSAAVIVTAVGAPASPLSDGSDAIWPYNGALSTSDAALFRHHFAAPGGSVTGATLHIHTALHGAWLNGTLLTGSVSSSGLALVLSIPPALIAAGGSNVLAVWAYNNGAAAIGQADWMTYALDVTYAGGSSLVATAGTPVEGDLLYYHDGQWTDLAIGTSGQALTVVSGDPAWATPSGGSVTSVALAGPTGTTVSGSPVTSSGTLTLSWASQSANVVLASPTGSSGAPTFRALVGADIPVDASTLISSAGTIKGNYQAGSGIAISGNTISVTGGGGSGTVTSVALTVPSFLSVAGSPITTSGALAVTLATQNVASVFAGPASGSAAAPAFRALQGSDLPAAASAGGHVHAHGHFL